VTLLDTTATPRHLGLPMSPKQTNSVGMAFRRKHAVWVGAVGAGKTVSSLMSFLMAISDVPPGGLIVIIGNTIQSIERNVIAPLQDPALYGDISKQVAHTNGSNRAIIMGRQVELIGASNALAVGRIRGSSIALAYVDEITLLREDFWDMLLTRLRIHDAEGNTISRLLATTNPASKNHWLRTRFLLNQDGTDTIGFHLTMDDNPTITTEDRALYESMYAGLFYQRMIEGRWTNAQGAVYDMWDPDTMSIPWSQLPPMADIIAVGVDHGHTHPTSAMMLGVTAEYDGWQPKPRLIMLDEWRYEPDDAKGYPRLTAQEQSVRLRGWLKQHHTPGTELLRPRMVYVDPAAEGFRLQLTRDRVTHALASNNVLRGISDVGSLLKSGRLLVARPDSPGDNEGRGCNGWMQEVTEYAWDTKATERGDDAVVKDKDDSADAFRYAVHSSRGVWEPLLRRTYGMAA
jgi:PBSX family phage terminase large subunit